MCGGGGGGRMLEGVGFIIFFSPFSETVCFKDYLSSLSNLNQGSTNLNKQ